MKAKEITKNTILLVLGIVAFILIAAEGQTATQTIVLKLAAAVLIIVCLILNRNYKIAKP